MTACGGKENVSEEPAEEAVEEVVEETEEVEEEVAEEVEDEATEEPAEEASSDYTKGTSTETSYESEWIGIRFTAPEGATMMTEEELNEMMGISQDMLSEDFNDLQLKIAEMNTVQEMMCTAADGIPNVTIAAEKIQSNMTLEEYMEMLKSTLEQVTSMAYTVELTDEVVTIGGKDFTKLSAVAEVDGATLNQDFFAMIQGDRAVSITLTYAEGFEDAADEMLNSFEAY